jgi:ribosomal protein S1
LADPWAGVEKKYAVGQTVKGIILKVNPFGLFVELDADIHGLAHVSQLGLAAGEKIEDVYNAGTTLDFSIISLDATDHRLGLAIPGKAKDKKNGKTKAKSDSKETKEEKSEVAEEGVEETETKE